MMASGELHFDSAEQLITFANGLQDQYPSRCANNVGVACGRVIGACVKLAEAVDLREISEIDATAKAKVEGADYGRKCSLGMNNDECGYGYAQ